MNATQYTPSSRWSPRVSIAEAAVVWHGLSQEQCALVLVEDGLPYLAGVEALTQRAEAILEAAEAGVIAGLTRNEDGYPLRPEHMRLDRESVRAWCSLADQRVAAAEGARAESRPTARVEPECMLTVAEVCQRLGISRATLSRMRSTRKFDEPHATGPNRWRNSYVTAYMHDCGSQAEPTL